MTAPANFCSSSLDAARVAGQEWVREQQLAFVLLGYLHILRNTCVILCNISFFMDHCIYVYYAPYCIIHVILYYITYVSLLDI